MLPNFNSHFSVENIEYTDIKWSRMLCFEIFICSYDVRHTFIPIIKMWRIAIFICYVCGERKNILENRCRKVCAHDLKVVRD
jgi:hypothetical protein